MGGKIFKYLRKQRNYTIEETTVGITSNAKLSRFEHEKIDIGFSVLCQLLARIGVLPQEFISLVINHSEEQNSFEQLVLSSFTENKPEVLAHIVLTQLEQFHEKKTKNELFKAASAGNYFYLLTGNNILQNSEITALISGFSDVTTWNCMDVRQYYNCTYILPNKFCFAMASELIASLAITKKQSLDAYVYSLKAITRSQYALIVSESSCAGLLAEKIANIDFPSGIPFICLRRKFCQQLLDVSRRKGSSLYGARSIVDLLTNCDAVQTANEFDCLLRLINTKKFLN